MMEAATQSKDVQIEKEVQTEDWPVIDKWCQHPSATLVECGVGISINESDQHQHGRENSREVRKSSKRRKQSLALEDNSGLADFLSRSAKICETLLDEMMREDVEDNFEMIQNGDCCQACLSLPTLDILQGRHCTCICFSPDDPRMLVTAWSPRSDSDISTHDYLSQVGVIILWDISNLTVPFRVLSIPAAPTSLAFAPYSNFLVAGTGTGSLYLYDLREAPSQYSHTDTFKSIDNLPTAFQLPTYTTDCIAGTLAGHQGAIVAVFCVAGGSYESKMTVSNVQRNDVQSALDWMKRRSNPFQVISVDEDGWIFTWVAVELPSPAYSYSATEAADLGIAPGERSKMTQTSSIHVTNPNRFAFSRTYKIQAASIDPTNNAEIILATDTAAVLRVSRLPSPSSKIATYHLPSPYTSTSNATHIALSPFLPQYFLIGYVSGIVALYCKRQSTAVKYWGVNDGKLSGTGLKGLSWSQKRPLVFFVVDTRNRVLVWDLKEFAECESYVQQLQDACQRPRNPPELTAVGFSSDRGVREKHGLDSKSFLAVANKDGRVEVLMLRSDLDKNDEIEDEISKLEWVANS
ncbi:WD40-repeat-containing domain protein [Paraphysoderma sedebokerense]|nr:WD40-repeat-containing domain protein [Paraphysoderma sedebokerense]